MLGLFVNVIAVVVGGSIGILLRKIVKKDNASFFEGVLLSLGVGIIIFGIYSCASSIKTIGETGWEHAEIEALLILLIALPAGTIIGQTHKLDYHLNRFSLYITNKFKREGDRTNAGEGFIAGSLLFCVGAMSIVGSILAGIGDNTQLYLKSVIDLFTSVLLGITLGYGVIFSALTILIYQGLFVLLGYFLNDFLSEKFINEFSMLGYAIIVCIGLNFIFKDKVKIANILPAIILYVIYYCVRLFIPL